MCISHDNLLDRLLRYAPWAAATLVGVCAIALVARVVSKAKSESEPAEIVASADVTEKASQKQPATPPHVVLRPEMATASEGRRTTGQPAVSRRAGPTTRSPKDPQTPSSKSKLEMHTVRRGNPADDSQRKIATKATTRTFIASSRSIAADVKSVPAGADSLPESGWHALKVRGKSGAKAASLDPRGYTSFFGIEAGGQRFAYVLDRSGSMGEPQNKPLRAAKAELLASLEKLDSLQQFFLIFYNEDVRQFVPGARGVHFADEGNKSAARRFVDSVQAQGGTRHFEALQRAINLRPDVIFLLTDGEQKDDLSDDELKRLNRLNGGLSQIHVIQFAAIPYEGNSLIQLASENRGQHSYKNIREIEIKERR
jgi:hypothetical protein